MTSRRWWCDAWLWSGCVPAHPIPVWLLWAMVPGQNRKSVKPLQIAIRLPGFDVPATPDVKIQLRGHWSRAQGQPADSLHQGWRSFVKSRADRRSAERQSAWQTGSKAHAGVESRTGYRRAHLLRSDVIKPIVVSEIPSGARESAKIVPHRRYSLPHS